MIGLKQIRLVMLSIVALALGVCIGKAPTVGPGNSWVLFLYASALVVVVIAIAEVFDKPSGGKAKDKGKGKNKDAAE